MLAITLGVPVVQAQYQDPPSVVFRFRRVEERKDIRTYFRQGSTIIGPIATHGIAFVYEMEAVSGQGGTVIAKGPNRRVGGQTVVGTGISTDTRSPGGDVTGNEDDRDATVLSIGDCSAGANNSIEAQLTFAKFQQNGLYKYEVAFVVPVSSSVNGGDFSGSAEAHFKAVWGYHWNPNQGNWVYEDAWYDLLANRLVATYDASVDSRKGFPLPDVEGGLPGDPNAEPSGLNFGQSIWKGGLFVGRMSPATRDQSGTARMQLKFPSFTPAGARYTAFISLLDMGSPSNAQDQFDIGLYLPSGNDANLSVGETSVKWESKWNIQPREQGYEPPHVTQHYFGSQNLPYESYTYNFSRDPILTLRVQPSSTNRYRMRANEFVALPVSLSHDPNLEWPYPDPWPNPYPNPDPQSSWPGYDYWEPYANDGWWYLDTIWDDTYTFNQSTYYSNRWHREAGYREQGLTNFCLAMKDESYLNWPIARWRWFCSRDLQAKPSARFPHNDGAPRLWFITYMQP